MKKSSNSSDTINFCHIAPTSVLESLTETNGSHLILAHLIDQEFNAGALYNPKYAEFYRTRNERGDFRRTTMDNSAFEMVKHNNGVMYDPDRLVEMGKLVQADEIVLSDYPGEFWKITQQKAIEQIPVFKAEGFDTFYVPQSEVGDMEGFIESFKWALNNPDIDTIGVSILGVPTAFGQETVDSKYLRSQSRYAFMNILKERGLLDEKAINRFHFLGALDNMYELQMCKEFFPFIKSSDSSVAAWRGLNMIEFDSSPTGMITGKFEKEVDFNQEFVYNQLTCAKQQIANWNKTLA